jgi:hypothetical protein
MAETEQQGNEPGQPAGEAGEQPVTPSEDTLTMEDLAGAAELVEVYETDSDIVASVIIDEILQPAGIIAYRHERRSRMIPAPAAMPGEIGIAVPAPMAEQARTLLREARADGVLTDESGIPEEEEEERIA